MICLTYFKPLYSFCYSGSFAGEESTCNAGDPSSIPGLGRSAGEGLGYPLQYSWASRVAQLVKNLPTMQEIWVGKIAWKGKGYPLQYSGLENSKDCIFPGVTKSHIQLSDFHFGGSDGKESICNVGDLGSIPALGRSPRGGHGSPL